MNRSTFRTLRIAGVVAALLAATTGAAQAQRAVIRGTVVSEGGQPIEGASVFVPELGVQTATDATGKYTITVPGTRVRGQVANLRVRMIGFRPGSRTLTLSAGEQVFDFTLAADVNRLEEIVVTGAMGGQEKTQTPFYISRVDVSDLPIPGLNPLAMLAGRVAGANIVSYSGRPGESPAVMLRGVTSINAQDRSQEPLYIVDGVIITGTLASLNAEDIESVEVVKGAAASSLYGARAGTGVIQITTKSGRMGREGVTWNAHSETGTSDIEKNWVLAQNTPMLMDAQAQRFCVTVTGQALCARTINYGTEAARVNNDPGLYALQPATFVFDPNSAVSGQPLRNNYQAQMWPGRTFNAVNQTVQPKVLTTNNLDVTGRFGETQFYASGSWTQQGGSIRYLQGYNHWTTRLNVDQRIGNQWSVGVRTFYSSAASDGADQQNGGQAFFRLTRVPAIVNLLQTDTLGRLYIRPNMQNSGEQNENPLMDFQQFKQQNYQDRFIGGITIRYLPVSWADIEANGSYDWLAGRATYFYDKNFRATSQTYWNGNYWPGVVQDNRSVASSFNAGLNATLRHDFGRDLQTRWNFRYGYVQQDNNNNAAYGNTLAAVGVPILGNATANYSVNSGTSSIREIGYSAGVGLTYLERYIIEGLIRRDGSSLFGSDRRWATFARGSVAWRVSQEPIWPFKDFMNEFKLRASRGSAGGRPNFYAQYETFGVSSGGISLNTLGNKQLQPEVTTETELGADIEILRRLGLTITNAQSQTVNQILPVPVQAYYGFGTQWKNAGTLQNKTWEVSLNVPIVSRRDLSWSWRFSYDQTQTKITQLNVPPFTYGVTYQQGATAIFMAHENEPYGTFYGHKFIRSCGDLPAAFQSQCGGAGMQFQYNDQGFLVWTGGLLPSQGITNNAYQAQLPAAQSPWGVAVNWGMLMTVKDSTCLPVDAANHPSYKGGRFDCPALNVPIGQALPKWNGSVTQNFQWRRLSVYALFQGSVGRKVWNEGRQWSYLDFLVNDIDQANRTVQSAKPVGYYYRGAPPTHANGIGGFYDALAPNSYFVEDASYGKLRELSLSYNLGPIGGWGNWSASVIGRNLLTATGYHGFDPEVGDAGSTTGSGAINAIDAYTFPNTRSFTFALSTSF
jgi:TonB-linked SusC/RagA family outer membrane protein